MKFLGCWFVGLFASIFSQTQAADWARWRGPNMDNIWPEPGRLDPWPATGPTVLWRTNVGTGYSSITVSQGRLYTMGNNRAGTDLVYCLEASSGRTLWTHGYPAHLGDNSFGFGPNATPTVDEGKVYTLSYYGDLFCFDATNGAPLWKTNLVSAFGARYSEWGFGSSPLVLGNKLILGAGAYGCALDKRTGELIWLSDTNRNGYATPVPCLVDGVPALGLFARREAAVVAQENGRVIWRIPWQSNFEQNVTDFIPHQGALLVSSYSRLGTTIPHTSVMLAFINGQLSTNWHAGPGVLASPLSPGVVLSNHFYSFTGEAKEDSGTLVCVDLDTGLRRWAQGGIITGSIIAVDGKLLILTGVGQLLLVPATPAGFSILSPLTPSSYILPRRCWGMPAFVDGVFYARNSVQNADGQIVAVALPYTPAEEPQPRLQISRKSNASSVEISWPQAVSDFRLQSREFSASPWTDVSTPPASAGEDNVVVEDTAGAGRIYRLNKPPQ